MPRMPDAKDRSGLDRVMRQTRLAMPVIGMESEFNVWLDEVEVDPREYWGHPGAFIDRPLLPREKTSLQLPTGGAGDFSLGGVGVVKAVIRLAARPTARTGRHSWGAMRVGRAPTPPW